MRRDRTGADRRRRARDEPAAIVANAARANQHVTITTLGGLGEAAAASPPISIIVIGENVKLREELNWLAQTAAQLSPAESRHSCGRSVMIRARSPSLNVAQLAIRPECDRNRNKVAAPGHKRRL